jgi:hypothetical protein
MKPQEKYCFLSQSYIDEYLDYSLEEFVMKFVAIGMHDTFLRMEGCDHLDSSQDHIKLLYDKFQREIGRALDENRSRD